MRPQFRLPPPVMMSINTGALLDIPTGRYIKGTHDQRVLLAGIGNITGLVGPGNSFKTTIMRFMILSALSKLYGTVKDLFYTSYDTEINTQEERAKHLSHQFEVFENHDLLDESLWQMTNRAIYPGNEWFTELKKYLSDKASEKKGIQYDTAFLDRDGVTPLKVMTPSFTDIDSLTHFMTSDVEKILDTVELGDSAGNMMYARQGLSKAKLLMEMPSLAASSFNYFLFTAHIGQQMLIPSAPGTPPPRKQLQHMSNGEVIKGVTNNFFYLLHNCWLLNTARPYLNQATKGPEYPYEQGDERAGDLDLFIVTMRQLRGKNGTSGFNVELLVSQRDGVLENLSDFHYVKKSNRFGLEGNDRNYSLALYPSIALSRTTVRQKLREDKKLARAMEITSQLCQMYEYHRDLIPELMEPSVLKKALEDKGYDWDWLLENTRSWHTLNDEEHPLYPLSTYDFCRIAQDKYHPYWLSKDCKTVKPEYAKKKRQPT
jgi:hypothetical protein